MAAEFSNLSPLLLASKVFADHDPTHVLAASEQKRPQRQRDQLSAGKKFHNRINLSGHKSRLIADNLTLFQFMLQVKRQYSD